MFSVIGELIPYGSAVTLSPLPIMAVLLLLMTPVGVRGAGAFLLARFLCLVAVAGGVGFLSHAADEAAGSKGPTASIRIVLGLLLSGLALLKWSRWPAPGEEPKIPKWMASIEASGLSSAFRLGLVLTIFNVKELAFAAGAGLAVGAAMLAPLQAGLSVLVFAVLACFTLILPVAGRSGEVGCGAGQRQDLADAEQCGDHGSHPVADRRPADRRRTVRAGLNSTPLTWAFSNHRQDA